MSLTTWAPASIAAPADLGPAGVDAHQQAVGDERRDHRPDAIDLRVAGDRLGARAGRLTADVDDQRTLRREPAAVGDGAGRVEVAPAVAERVGRDVHDAHHRGRGPRHRPPVTRRASPPGRARGGDRRRPPATDHQRSTKTCSLPTQIAERARSMKRRSSSIARRPAVGGLRRVRPTALEPRLGVARVRLDRRAPCVAERGLDRRLEAVHLLVAQHPRSPAPSSGSADRAAPASSAAPRRRTASPTVAQREVQLDDRGSSDGRRCSPASG